MHLNTDSNNNR